MTWDVFICHASEDKGSIAKPLADKLKDNDLEVWYDEFTLKLGDKLRRSIDNGLKESKYGIVILSESFFTKE
ncbi:MAG: toll/interleukin-1 receptor domain-containing protein [Candidatus Aenigmarchaeota archaeon]|nr:toll/interleukin-1 receptor domain-containing protein [Candidatus Aenigmarchaeota archaeon]